MSKHFTWDEVTKSSTARIKHILNKVPERYVPNVLATMDRMEIVRHLLGDKPLHVNSWYRCPELNKAVGGSSTSAHLKGLAVDFECEHLGLAQVFQKIALSSLPFDQLIHEGTKDGANWVHIGFSNLTPRRQVLTAWGEKLGGTMAFARYHVTTG